MAATTTSPAARAYVAPVGLKFHAAVLTPDSTFVQWWPLPQARGIPGAKTAARRRYSAPSGSRVRILIGAARYWGAYVYRIAEWNSVTESWTQDAQAGEILE